MKIIKDPDLLSILTNKHLLLDTNVFIDAFSNPVEFGKFFNELTDNQITLVTLEFIKIEFLKGSFTVAKYSEKEQFLTNIISDFLPFSPDLIGNVYSLIKLYKEDGKGVSFADFLLGATLMKYRSNIFLMSKNATDFPDKIFKVVAYVNVFKNRSLQCYGVYQFKET